MLTFRGILKHAYIYNILVVNNFRYLKDLNSYINYQFVLYLITKKDSKTEYLRVQHQFHYYAKIYDAFSIPSLII